jgi:hypothetical protein
MHVPWESSDGAGSGGRIGRGALRSRWPRAALRRHTANRTRSRPTYGVNDPSMVVGERSAVCSTEADSPHCRGSRSLNGRLDGQRCRSGEGKSPVTACADVAPVTATTRTCASRCVGCALSAPWGLPLGCGRVEFGLAACGPGASGESRVRKWACAFAAESGRASPRRVFRGAALPVPLMQWRCAPGAQAPSGQVGLCMGPGKVVMARAAVGGLAGGPGGVDGLVQRFATHGQSYQVPPVVGDHRRSRCLGV